MRCHLLTSTVSVPGSTVRYSTTRSTTGTSTLVQQHDTSTYGSSEIFRVRSMDFDFDFGRSTTDGAQMAIEFRGGSWSPLNLEFREERGVKGKEIV